MLRLTLICMLLLGVSSALADGAVAIGLMGDTQWRAGIETNKSTSEKAVTTALEYCNERTLNSTNCYLYLRFRNQCAAVAIASGNFGIGIGDTEAEATADALDTCNRITPGCTVEASKCDSRLVTFQMRLLGIERPPNAEEYGGAGILSLLSIALILLIVRISKLRRRLAALDGTKNAP
jgi:hypothetical protein